LEFIFVNKKTKRKFSCEKKIPDTNLREGTRLGTKYILLQGICTTDRQKVRKKK
jgi:hypothetical protein